MRTTKQKILLTSKIIGVVFILLIIGFLVFRNELLNQAIDKVSTTMNLEYNSSFVIKKASFNGLSGIELEEITLAPKNLDTLFKIQKIKTSVNLLHLFIGDVQLGTLEIKNGNVLLTKKGNVKNFGAFLKKDKNEPKTTKKRDYAEFAYRIITKILNLVPTDMTLDNLVFKLDDNGKKATINIKKLTLFKSKLESSIDVQTNTFTQRWRINGFADPRNKKGDIRFFNIDTGAIKVPYFDERYNLKASFDSIRLKVQNIDMSHGELHLDGFTSITNLKMNHKRIANKDVVIKNARFDYRFLLGSDFISIDSSSTIQFNKIKLHPYLSYNTEKDTVYKLKVAIPKMRAQDFITSLPDGLFTHFQGMEATGGFDYKLDFMFNKNKPNTIVFKSNINKQNLNIIKYGNIDLAKLNGEFTYRAIDNGVPQRPIFVGSSNPYYTPFDQISPYLQKCVLTSEDPSFMSHHGFINEAFKQSILKNIRTKKFSRGASTISMQLVKNVFLTREKTLSRKLEEILLVYIIENNRITSKQRMLEVYFNIIEWGPNVYGIGEAAEFYFQKKPADLNVRECLYLATIIPKPKKFMWQFDQEGLQKSYATKQQAFLRNLMFRRGLLVPEDTIGLSAPVTLTGRAHSLLNIKVKDTTVIDSIAVKEEFDF
ncbi:transglycosylase domain-containing protein [Flavobacterium aestivum]|uniref:transglycosylase domain-containing protein n=1 Tax=Flavobacterium aestivum TaxID=3003257 RepID=UPI0024830021|nr:biosynthetic peptidoglycan transglycosylase [Flavobacterium aestivum]